MTATPPVSDPNRNSTTASIKFLYSYAGRITPRSSDGSLRYIGGFTRVLSVPRSLSFSDLMVKFMELCGTSMNLKCKLPKEDLDLLISIRSDEDLQNVIDEYDRDAPGVYIRAILFPIASLKLVSPPSSPLLMPRPDYLISKIAGLDLHHQQQPPPSSSGRTTKYVSHPPSSSSRLYNCADGGRRDVYCRRHGKCRPLYPDRYPIVANKP